LVYAPRVLINSDALPFTLLNHELVQACLPICQLLDGVYANYLFVTFLMIERRQQEFIVPDHISKSSYKNIEYSWISNLILFEYATFIR